MTLEELLDHMNTLYPSAQSALVTIRKGNEDWDVMSIRYESGDVIIECEDFAENDDVN